MAPILLCPQCLGRLTARLAALAACAECVAQQAVPRLPSRPIVQTDEAWRCLLEPEHTAGWDEVLRRLHLKEHVSQWQKAW
jgi:hypothetical protein